MHFFSLVLNGEDSDGSVRAWQEKCWMELPIRFHHIHFARLCEFLAYSYRLQLLMLPRYCFTKLQADAVNQRRFDTKLTHPFISNSLITFTLLIYLGKMELFE